MTPEIKTNHPLIELNTFKIEAYSTYFFELNSVDDYHHVLNNSELKRKPKLILGSGSNILFTKNYPGIVIHNKIKGIEIQKEDEDYIYLIAGGGEIWDDLVIYSTDRNLWGIENLAAIPGTVGAAPVQNIGAYGCELYDVFHYAEGFYLSDMELKKFYRGDCEFSYRNSIFKKKLKNEFLITKVVLKLRKNANPQLEYGELKKAAPKLGENLTSTDIEKLVREIRGNKLPDINEYGNAGSFFKNPVVGKSVIDDLREKYADLIYFEINPNTFKIPAGWLIEKTGWKGTKFGNVGSYKKQALVIINFGGATGREISSFANMVKESVEEKFSITLEEEVNII